MRKFTGFTNGLLVGAFFVLVLLTALARAPLSVEWVMP